MKAVILVDFQPPSSSRRGEHPSDRDAQNHSTSFCMICLEPTFDLAVHHYRYHSSDSCPNDHKNKQ